jgi:hypothetical protein
VNDELGCVKREAAHPISLRHRHHATAPAVCIQDFAYTGGNTTRPPSFFPGDQMFGPQCPKPFIRSMVNPAVDKKSWSCWYARGGENSQPRLSGNHPKGFSHYHRSPTQRPQYVCTLCFPAHPCLQTLSSCLPGLPALSCTSHGVSNPLLSSSPATPRYLCTPSTPPLS